jgi:RNA-directed DNA polymerase
VLHSSPVCLWLLIVFDRFLGWRTINIQTQFRDSLGSARIFGNHTSVGAPFLAKTDFRFGQNLRRYPNGKLLIKPSKKNVKTFLDGIRRIIKASIGRSAADLIGKLNPKIRGWANYHRHVVSKHTFVHVDSIIFCRIWQWARRRHPKKSSDWLKKKYFGQRRGRDWSFFSETCDDEGQPGKLWLHRASSTPIKRHIKVKGEANPYDPANETYFAVT